MTCGGTNCCRTTYDSLSAIRVMVEDTRGEFSLRNLFWSQPRAVPLLYGSPSVGHPVGALATIYPRPHTFRWIGSSWETNPRHSGRRVPRDTSGDHIRGFTGPAILSSGFRPFFLFGALWAALAVAL